MSPSRRHLGIYKSLLKDLPTKEEQKQKTPVHKGINVMHSIFALIKLAITHTHTFERWKKIWNMFIEKDPGQPRINRLQTIHLMEADYNLLLKYFAAQGFLKQSERHNRITDAQGGGRQGCSAIDLACKKVITYDIIQTTKEEATDLFTDLEGCFDRMIENCQNLSCHQHGADPSYLKLHAQTHQQLKYFVKHAFGESTEFNTFEIHPWYGAGQGARDAAIRWIVLSDSLIMAYLLKAHQWAQIDHKNNRIIDQGIDAFIDDTTIFNATTSQKPLSFNNLISQTQDNISLWNGLLEASGGTLNPTKCVWAYFRWINMNGTLTLAESKQET